jgi:hypothetical protein
MSDNPVGLHDLLQGSLYCEECRLMGCHAVWLLEKLRDIAGHIYGFRGEDGRILELNAVSLVDTVLSYGRSVWMF